MGGDGRSDRYARQQAEAAIIIAVAGVVAAVLAVAFLIGLFI